MKQPHNFTVLNNALNNPELWHKYAGTASDGSDVSVFLIVGSLAWKKSEEIEHSHLFLMMPFGISPLKYCWNILSGHDPIIIIIAGERPNEYFFKQLSFALIRDGVQRLLYPMESGGKAVRCLSSEVIL